MKKPEYFQKSQALFERARKVTPCGIYGHTTPAATVPGAFPYFAQRAEGCRYWDVDGHEYIDFLCAYGPNILGYNHPKVEDAAARAQRDGNCLNHPTEQSVLLAEKLISLVDFASWAVFGKNGSDMTTWAIQVAREHTGRKKILKVKDAYHGSHPWCTPGHGGLLPEDRAHILEFIWNDCEDFKRVLKLAGEDAAGVIISAFHHPIFGDSILPDPAFLKLIEESCHRKGIVFILDDVRSGFRLHLGGSHRYFGFEPDLICFCKALGNGHPISATLGRENLRIAASRVFLTGSYWNSSAPMAASLAVLEILEKEETIAHLKKQGERLMEGLRAAAEKNELKIRCSGPPALPFMSFADETNFYRSQHFTSECILRGVFFHPHHNWFMCGAHRDRDLDHTLKAADEAFASVREHFGPSK